LDEARAKAALAAARANLADLAERFTAAHPDVRAAQAEVERATNRLTAATAATMLGSPTIGAPGTVPPLAASALSHSIATSGPSAAALVVGAAPSRPRAGRPRAPAGDVVALETEWVMLTRETTKARQHQDQVDAALFKANSATDAEQGNHGVDVTTIDPAFLPQTAVPPGRTVVVAIFAGVSLLLAVVSAAFQALLNDRVYAERDVSLLAPVLVLIPRRTRVARP
jgi:hypothetical protein